MYIGVEITNLDASIIGSTVHDIRCIIYESNCIHIDRIRFHWHLVRISIGCQIINVQAAIAAAANNLLATIRKGHRENTEIWFRRV